MYCSDIFAVGGIRSFDTMFLPRVISVIMFGFEMKRYKENKWIRAINKILAGWEIIRNDKKLIIEGIISNATVIVINALQLVSIYKKFAVNLEFLSALYLSTISLVSLFINVTPDGLGVKEAIFSFSESFVSIDAETLVMGSLTLRTISIFSALLFGGLSYLYLNRKKVFILLEKI